MKPKNPKLIEEMDVEVVNRQPTETERSEISGYIARDKEKLKLRTRRAVKTTLADKL